MRLPPSLVTDAEVGDGKAHPSLDAQQLCQRRGRPRCPSKQVAASKNYYQEHRQNANGSATLGPALFLQLLSQCADVPLTKIIFWHSLVTYIRLLKLLDL
jgi:hypothetical protein